MNKNPDNPQNEISPVQLAQFRTELRPIFDRGYSTFGHGVRPELAPEAFDKGLEAKSPDLLSTTIPLFTHGKDYEDQTDETFLMILNWPHHNLKAVVIVMIPNAPEDKLGGIGYFNSVFEETDNEETGYENKYVIPQNTLRGMLMLVVAPL